jgi:hypothetical protein
MKEFFSSKISKSYFNLQIINIAQSSYIHDDLLASVAHKCLNLIDCNFEHLYNITNHSIIVLSQLCPLITSLSLSNCSLIGDAAVDAIATQCRDLSSLDISSCNITDGAILSLADHCSELVALNLAHSYALSVDAVKTLLQSCSTIKSLNLEFCTTALTDQTLRNIARYLPEVLTLNLSHSRVVTDRGVQALCEGCPLIQDLQMRWLDAITLCSIQVVAVRLERLQRVVFENLLGYGNDKPFMILIHNFRSLKHFDFSNGTVSGEQFMRGDKDYGAHSRVYETDIRTMNKMEVIQANICSMAPKCTKLESLTVCGGTGADALLKLLSVVRHLTAVNLEFCKDVLTDRHLEVLAATCSGLTQLSVQRARHITDAGVVAVVEANRGLLKINCAYCGKLTSQVVTALVRCVPRIEYVDLSHCRIGDESILLLVERCRYLSLVNVEECPCVTVVSLQALTTKCEYLVHLFATLSSHDAYLLGAEICERFHLRADQTAMDRGGDPRDNTTDEVRIYVIEVLVALFDCLLFV